MTDKQKLDRNKNLSHYILRAQYDLNIPEDLQLDKDTELQYIDDILKQFQEDTAERYFANNHSFYIPKSKYVIKEKDYFLFLLYSFLDKHEYDSYFWKYKICGNLISAKNFEKGIYFSTYELTDFGLVVYKLLYILQTHYEKTPTLNPKSYSAPHIIEKREESIRTKTILV